VRDRTILGLGLLVVAGALVGPLHADDLPEIEHQPSPCIVPDEPYRLCAKVSDDAGVGKARVYFRRAGETYYAFVDMSFDGLTYCATLPGPRGGRTRLIEYYVQAIDNGYQAVRSSTFQLQVKPATECEFAPVEKDPARRARLTVYATHAKQGKKPSADFHDAGVTFVPVAGK
jgi:hypothetical protein